MNNEKIKKMVGFSPNYNLEEGLLKSFGPDKSDYFMMSRLFGIEQKE